MTSEGPNLINLNYVAKPPTDAGSKLNHRFKVKDLGRI